MYMDNTHEIVSKLTDRSSFSEVIRVAQDNEIKIYFNPGTGASMRVNFFISAESIAEVVQAIIDIRRKRAEIDYPQQLRQEMPDSFFEWMNFYMNIDENNPHYTSRSARMGDALVRHAMYESYMESCSENERRYLTPQRFWKYLVTWCQYYGFLLNPGHISKDGTPGHVRQNGVEVITISAGTQEGGAR